MICINKSLKFELPEKRISLFNSIYQSKLDLQVSPFQQNSSSLPRSHEKCTKHLPGVDLGVSSTIFACGERPKEKGNHSRYDEGFCL